MVLWAPFFFVLLASATTYGATVEGPLEDDPSILNSELRGLLSQPSIHKPFSYHQEFLTDTDEDYPFSYNHDHDIGPHRWGHHYPLCNGEYQSPINIRTKRCPKQSFRKPLNYVNNDKSPTLVTIENNGYSIGWTFEYNGTRPYLTGGPLTANYVLETMHIHWGTEQTYGGSEHWIDDVPGDMEMHLIHRNIKYATFNIAKDYKDGLVVVGILSKTSKSSPPLQMFKNVNDIREPFTSVRIDGFPKGYILKNLMGFLPEEEFLYYPGSLTTPPCNEATTWLVAKKIRSIGVEDVSEVIVS